jgi:AcrR family transcriptional regulator
MSAVRTRGWQGDLPRDEDEARTRILDAATRCVERFGSSKTRLADVANELGVTRQTVYRYFPSVSEMLAAVAAAGAGEFLDRMADDLSFVSTPEEAVTETVVYCLRTIPGEPALGLLLRADESELFTRGATSSQAIALGAGMLRRFRVDWASRGLDDGDMESLAEVVVRLFLSFLQYPADPPRSDDELRVFLRTWIAPALAPGVRTGHHRAGLGGS